MSFTIIAITPPLFFDGEAERINKILSGNEAHYVHIRKPDSSKEEISALIEKIDSRFHDRVKLHDHFELIDKFQLGGVHLNSRNPYPPLTAKSVSISLHSLEEIEGKDKYDYYFISPIFDSISKDGYNAAFNLNDLALNIRGHKAIALGGVTPSKFSLLRSLGFSGAALLGYFFPKTLYEKA